MLVKQFIVSDMKKFIVLLLLLAGCASYNHSRVTDGSRTTETTQVGTLLMTGKVSKINSEVRDGAYSRKVGFGAITGAGDVEFLKALFEAGAAAGAKAAAAKPADGPTRIP